MSPMMRGLSEIDPRLDLFEEIGRLKRARRAVILAHFYQEPDIQDVADFVGDSLGLAQEAARTDAAVIAFAGVHFMAETAKILNPDKVVLLDLGAGCSLADSCPPDQFRAFLERYPGHTVVTYINCSAAVKALIHQMAKACPPKAFIPAPPDNGCACNECPHMRRNTLEKIYLCLRDLEPAITLDEDLRRRALRPIQRMLALS